MCAIAGFLGLDADDGTCTDMLKTMARRGPDAQGRYRSPGCTLLHTRLAIIDPAGGKQPMCLTQNGETYVLIYNGELYNTEELRTEMTRLGHIFREHSDTEVVLHAYAQWGSQCTSRFNGIFAFAVWEQGRGRLFLARDRIGVKPLFYTAYDGGFVFASEMKTILSFPGISARLDRQGAAQLIMLGPGRLPGSGVFYGIQELEPGCQGYWEKGSFRWERYWRLQDRENRDSLAEAVAHTRYLVTDAVHRQMVSDVPLGAFLSGGLDSTLALLVCVKTFDKLELPRKNIIGITMPGFGTTDRTYNNALHLMASLGVTIKEISIKEACIRHFKDIDHDMTVHDVTYENSQARERTQILMDVANRLGGLVIGTGDLSELALGWATYNGDHMSMYGVNASIPKTLVKYLVNWIALNGVDNESRITLLDIVDTPISPELIPADEQGNIKQKTEDLVGPYELHDFFLYQFLRFGFRPGKIFYLASIAFRDTYNEEVIKKWLTTFCRRFFQQQFKRSCLPDGPKVGSVSLSPRGDWRMPSDASAAMWLKECEEL